MLTPTAAYHEIVDTVLTKGTLESNRTGINALTIAGASFTCDGEDGFPAITTKKLAFKSVLTELEFFIKGITDKKWLQDRKCSIWDEWCRPDLVAYSHSEENRDRMRAERDLGPVYGFQWRHFGAEYKSYDTDYSGQGVDQLANAIETLRKDPRNRRVLVQAWNPTQIHMMALPACHFGFQLTVTNGRLNLIWNQRSCDLILGVPFNIASYAALQYLIARDLGLPVGKLVGHLNDVHIYENHLEGALLQMKRDPNRHKPPIFVVENPSTSIFDWESPQSKLDSYTHDEQIKFEVAV